MNELNMIRVLLDEVPPSAEVIAEGRRRIAASATEPGRPAALRGVASPETRPATGHRPAWGRGFRHRPARGFHHRTARRVAAGAAAAGAAAALALVTLVPHGAPAARPSHGQADELAGLPARGFLLTMAVKTAAGGQSTGRWYCQQMESGQRMLVGADDTTLQAPWDQGPAASLAGYRYAIFGKYTVQSCFQPPTKGAPDGTVEGATQQLGAQPASPADAAAWRRAGSPASWIAWYDKTVRITTAPGPRRHAGPRNLTEPSFNYAALPTSPARLKAYILAHRAELGNTGTQSEVLYDNAFTFMNGQSPPAVRAAAYRVLASLPGIRMKPNVQDPAGQSGTALWLPQAGPTLALTIVDPATSTPLCVEEIAQQQIPAIHVALGTVIDYTLFTGSGWTNKPLSG
jgi:hypothetical protein